MTTLTAREARASLYRLIDEAAESHKPILISGKRHDAVLVSAERGRLGGDPGDAVPADRAGDARERPCRHGGTA